MLDGRLRRRTDHSRALFTLLGGLAVAMLSMDGLGIASDSD